MFLEIPSFFVLGKVADWRAKVWVHLSIDRIILRMDEIDNPDANFLFHCHIVKPFE
jgi:hypothetical protein